MVKYPSKTGMSRDRAFCDLTGAVQSGEAHTVQSSKTTRFHYAARTAETADFGRTVAPHCGWTYRREFCHFFSLRSPSGRKRNFFSTSGRASRDENSASLRLLLTAAIAVAFLILGSKVLVLPFRAIAFLAVQWRATTLVFGSVAMSVFFLELALRLLEGVPLTLTENFVARALNEVRQTGSSAVYDPQLGWAPLPNQGDAGEYGIRMPRQSQIPLRKKAVLMVGIPLAPAPKSRRTNPGPRSWRPSLAHRSSTRVLAVTALIRLRCELKCWLPCLSRRSS